VGKGNDSAGTRYACPHVGNYFFGHSWRFAIYFEPPKSLAAGIVPRNLESRR
jgi:hypothetical protein